MRNFLIESGVYPNLKGFNYIIKAVELVMENPQIKITKELYPKIAKLNNDSCTRVERAIRHVVTDKIPSRKYRDIGLNKSPNNGEFIHYFALKIKEGKYEL